MHSNSPRRSIAYLVQRSTAIGIHQTDPSAVCRIRVAVALTVWDGATALIVPHLPALGGYSRASIHANSRGKSKASLAPISYQRQK